ncbi:MAG: GTP 3',8-cyclase MoaA [Proteobacteria bacterium]|nr:GTP 3',8-cyclase MoaA [Pseudomonadota bacterium]
MPRKCLLGLPAILGNASPPPPSVTATRIIPVVDARAVPTGRTVAPARDADLAVLPWHDRLQRPLRDLRISVTDRCNFRCVYCMPKDVFDADHVYLPHGDLLSFEEIARVARIFVDAGVEKIRLTGGEPLLRRHIERLVEMLAKLPVDLTLTTNGALLARKAQALRDAGLARVTVSLDALDDPTFRRMNDVDFPVQDVLDGIDAAAAAGLAPIKVNAVIRRGWNEHAVTQMAGYFRHSGHVVRFIEYMDVGATNGWRMDDVVPAREMIAAIDAQWPLEPVAAHYEGEVAQRWRYRDGAGEVGVIASVTQAFCRDCTRARLSTDGKLYTCLFATSGHDLRGPLRAGADDAALRAAIGSLWLARDDRYSEVRTAATARAPKVEMSYIGG